MQIAQIVPNVRTTDEGIFDYTIPPEFLAMIKIGVLVEIPFHGRNIEGIIINIKRSSPIENLKKIASIIDPIPVIDKVHIELAKWMADYYLAPFEKTLFENIVPPAKRKINKNEYSKFAPAGNEYRYSSKKILLIANFQTRLKIYLEAIRKTLLKNKSVIVLVPDLSLIPYFTKYFKAPYVILHAGLTRTQRWEAWNNIRIKKGQIVIGSQSALFAPSQNLGLIIIDQEENETYKNDRSPRFHAVTTAEKLIELENSNLILGSQVPRIETFYVATKNHYHILNNKNSSFHNSNVSIIDMNSEKYVISNTLEKEIEKGLQRKEKILLIYNRKGEGAKFSCADCGWIAACEKCGLPLVPQRAENVCYRCEINYSPPPICPKCKNIQLKPIGLGTAKLKKFLTDLFPEAKILQIEKGLDGKNIKSDWDIAITTSYGLKFSWPKITLVGMIDGDQGLNFPDFNSPQKTFQTIYKFLKIGVKGIIQTHLPENYVISAVARLDYERFFLDELAQRKKYGFPPFTHLIRLLFKSDDKERILKETARVYNAISAISEKQYLISQPYPAFIEKERGKFRYQIVIKSQISNLKSQNELRNILRRLPKGWAVDVDPINLL